MVMTMMMLALVGLACSTRMGRPNGGARSFLCRGSGVTQMPSDIPQNTTELEVTQTQLKVIPHAAFTRLKELQKLVISENGALENIEALAFANLPALTHITISKCKYLVVVHKDAFVGLPMLQYLIISNTGLRVLPDFSQIHSNALEFLLDLQENYIERIPSNAFSGLCTGTISEMRLIKNGIREVESYAFNGTAMKRLVLTGNQQLTRLHSNAFAGSSELLSLDISHTALSSLPVSILGQLLRLTAVSVHALRELPPVRLFGRLKHANLTYPFHCCAFHNARRNRSQSSALCSKPKARENQPFYGDHCATSVACSPAPDAFNPCEDVMGCSFLQVLIWVISILALLGNAAVLLVLLGSRAKLTVPHFLMCHLAFAGLCMGIYLVIIAAVDMRTRGRYYNHAIDWQRGPGCKAAGFFTVFASELSVFTLTAITLERWHTITHALRLDHKLRLRHACVVMSGGWAFSCLAALLPTMGVSSYSKVSICLPMDVESLQSQIYLVFLLLLNVLAFVCVCACYLSIYLTVRNPSSAPARADTRVAQRMAVLIFTDFLCMAPISFFAISAALKLPLITVSHAKLLLVFFYPINSCANPFLYAFFTRTFRRDFFMLAARFGVCTTRAQIYRTESSSAQQAAWIPSPKTSLGTLYSLGSLSQHSHCPLTLYPSGSGRSSPPPS